MQKPLVSIIIPFKNTMVFLPECIDSIIEQEYKNWEILAVDDHSTDNSKNLLNAYAQKDSRIQVFTNHGNGIINALRLGYLHSKGEFITRMDSDDIMTPNKISVMANSLIEKGKGHVAVGQVKYFSEKGISNGYERYEEWLNSLTQKGTNYTEIYKECAIPSPCWMVSREDFDACSGFQPDRYPEDYDLAFQFYKNGLKCIPCNKVLLHWRDYDTRTSRTSEHYAQNYFLDIKLHYFLEIERDTRRPLVLWGAGNKGKAIAKSLIDQQIEFYWVCDNPKKIGKDIYGKEMLHFEKLNTLKNAQSIVTVANDGAQNKIRAYFASIGQSATKYYFFFC